jgi:THO complex subunit 5
MALFCKTCDDIRKLMEAIAKLKARNAGVNNEQILAEISEKRIQTSLLFVVLKKLNRLEKFRTKTSRDTLNREKQQVDSFHLQLQNLLYEILHLKKEVTKCLQFK